MLRRKAPQALDSVDFIKRYIFSGSYIPCVSSMVASAAQAGQLRLLDLQDIGDSYAKTIHAWRERFLSREADVLALGYDRRFLRMWDFYLAYCEAGFLEQSISDVHLLFARSGNRRVAALAARQALKGLRHAGLATLKRLGNVGNQVHIPAGHANDIHRHQLAPGAP